MTRIILLTALLVSTAQAQSKWRELKDGSQILECFINKTLVVAKPLFGRWRTPPTYNARTNTFEATWSDSVGGTGHFEIATGAPPAMLSCQWTQGSSGLGSPVAGIICAPNMANGIVVGQFSRGVRMTRETARMSEDVPVMMIKGDRIWCTN